MNRTTKRKLNELLDEIDALEGMSSGELKICVMLLAHSATTPKRLQTLTVLHEAVITIKRARLRAAGRDGKNGDAYERVALPASSQKSQEARSE